MAKLVAKNYDNANLEHKSKLKDCGHNILECSSCNKPLLDIWVIQPTNQILKHKATCPYCGGFSYTKETKGRIAPGGIPEDGDYNSDESRVLTFMDSFDIIEENGEAVILYKIGKNN